MSLELLDLLVGVLMIVILLPLHESAHAFVANRLGDPTARAMGRLTLNPLRHIDPMGAILLLTVHFGWGRPVPVDTRYFKNPKRDMALVAIAGPLSNLLIAFLLVVLYKLAVVLLALLGVPAGNIMWLWTVLAILQSLALTSIYLAVFNLIPVPPLDGSRLLEYLIPGGYYARVAPYQNIIYFAMMALLLFGVLSRPLSILANWIFSGMDAATAFIPLLGNALLMLFR